MKTRLLCVCLAVLLLVSGSALAQGLSGLGALSAIATAASPTPLELPDVFEIVYRTAEGEVSLSRDADGSFTYVNGDTKLVFAKTGDDAYTAENETGTLTFDEVKERIAPVWQMIEPDEDIGSAAVTAAFETNVTILDRKANRFRQSVHTDFSTKIDTAVWYTFDKATGICLIKETGTDEIHDNAEIVYECVSFR